MQHRVASTSSKLHRILGHKTEGMNYVASAKNSSKIKNGQYVCIDMALHYGVSSRQREKSMRILAFYRPPNNVNYEAFMKHLENSLERNTPADCIVLLDINIDIMRQGTNGKRVEQYENLVLSSGLCRYKTSQLCYFGSHLMQF